jgi:benzoyl-CoA reductase/2-hydroxyglutaryl-CoA dehydratase subunit BcrC/BadD/HgdB
VHRLALGAALLDQLPRPDLLVSSSHYCDGKAKVNEFMAERYGVEYLLVDMPMEDTPAARAYLESQLREIYARLADLAGMPADQGLLAGPLRAFKDMTAAMSRFNELRKGTPSPLLPGNRGFSFSFMGSLLYGTPAAEEIYRRLEQEFLAAQREGAVPAETLRFLWLMASPTYDVSIFPFLEARGGRIVMEEFSHCYWEPVDEGSPLAAIARRMLSNPFMGPVERRAETAAALARQYRVDAALHFGHLPCRQSNGALQVIKDRLGAQGVRLVNLEADLSDPSNFPRERIEDQLLAVWEILQSRPA